MAVKGQVFPSFVLINGTIATDGFHRKQIGLFNSECLFSFTCFSDIKSVTACTILQLSPKCAEVSFKIKIKSFNLIGGQNFFAKMLSEKKYRICDKEFLRCLLQGSAQSDRIGWKD